MKIKTQVSISLIVFVILASLIIFSIYHSNNQLQEITNKQQIIGEIEKGSFELYSLENDYLLHGGRRPVEQWHSKYNLLSGQLEELKITDPDQQAVFNALSDGHTELQATFSNFVAVTGSVQGNETMSASQELKEYAWSTLAGQTQMMMFRSSELSQLVKAEALQIQQRNTLIISASIAVLMVFVFLNYLIINRSVLMSISALQKGTEIIGSGNLDAKIEAGSSDELGDLSLAFNAMTSNLKTARTLLLTSKSELERGIAEQKQAVEALRESKDKYRTLFQTMAQGVVYQSSDGKIISANPAAERILGLTIDQMMGRTSIDPIWRSIHEDGSDFPGETHASMVALQTGREVHNVVMGVFNPIKGGYTWLTINAVPQFMPGKDKPYQVYTTFEDITERKMAEQQRESLLKELAQKNAELEQFSYTVSHDLKSPLITIKGFLGLLKKDAKTGDQERVQEDINHISGAAGKMEQLLTTLLELSQIGRIMNPPVRVSTKTLAEEAAEFLAIQIRNHNVTVSIADDLPEVYGDRTRLLEVFTNLLDNAIKFMGDQKEPYVEITGCHEAGEEIICVKDNGIGIEPENRSRIFSPFERLNTIIPGTGIGLTLVRRIVEVHSGRIWVESEGKGTGSTFCFTLPGVPRDKGEN